VENKKYNLFFCLLAIGFFYGCEERLFAGLTLTETFPDEAVHQLAGAAANGDTNQIDQLIAKGSNVNAQGKYGVTPLWWAFSTFAWVVKNKRISPKYYPERQKVIDFLKAKGMTVEIKTNNFSLAILHLSPILMLPERRVCGCSFRLRKSS
jgi:hypothetical protein